MDVGIRQLCPDDMDEIFQISLKTGNAGGDATDLYDDPKLIGQIYAAPYAKFHQDLCFVASDQIGVVGFVVGVIDTPAFFDELEAKWWPGLRKTCPVPDQKTRAGWSADQHRHQMIHFPEPTPVNVTKTHPAHLHLNLLSRAQGQGIGRQLLDTWLKRAAKRGAKFTHVGVNPANLNGSGFWQACGFKVLNAELSLPLDQTTWLGRRI